MRGVVQIIAEEPAGKNLQTLADRIPLRIALHNNDSLKSRLSSLEMSPEEFRELVAQCI